MKLFIATLIFAAASASCFAQDKASTATSNTTFTSQAPQPHTVFLSEKDKIMGKLSGLDLSDAQRSSAGDAVQAFLAKKEASISATSRSLFEDDRQKLMDKMKGILTEAQFKKFMKMKPATTESDNPLFPLFY